MVVLKGLHLASLGTGALPLISKDTMPKAYQLKHLNIQKLNNFDI